jgi:DHA2 family multidrug resistance protein-like MFS transporter
MTVRRAGPREWAGLTVLAMPVLLIGLDASVLYLALPHLGADLAPSSSQLLWILDIYSFMVVGFLLTMGNVGDRIGRRRLLVFGAFAFGAASVLAAYAPDPGVLVVARSLLGIAAAMMMPSTLSLLSNMFHDARQRAFAIGVWMAAFSGGTIVGPIVGGVLLEWFWWGSVFLLGVPVMVVLLAAAPLLPEYRAGGVGRIDLISVALFLGAVLPVVYGLKELAKDGWEPVPPAAIAAGVAVGFVFARRQRRLADPLLDLSLFAGRAFSAALVVLLLGLVVMAGVYLFVTQYLQLVQGLSPLRAGLLLVPAAAGELVMTMLAPVIARRVRPAYLVAAGLLISAAGLVVLAQTGATTGAARLVTGMVLMLLGTAPMLALSTVLVVGSAPPEKAGTAAAMPETGGELGVAVGVATMGSLGTLVYRSEMAGTSPEGVPAEASAAARDSLPGAVAAAGELPAGLGAALLEPARVAFTSGLSVVAATSAGLMVGIAALTLTLLRHVRPIGESEQPAEDADQVKGR